VGQTVHIDGVGALVKLVPDVHPLLASHEVDQLVAVLTHDHRPVMAGHVMPGNAVVELVVEDGQTGLVVELLEAIHGDADVVVGLDGSFLDTFVVVRLGFPVYSSLAPEGLGVGPVSGWYPLVVSPSPEPPVHVNRLQVGPVTALILEVALATTGVYGSNIIPLHDLLEHLVLPGGVEGDEVHAPVTAEVPPVEPVPVLKFMPRFPPREEVVVLPHLHVRLACHALLEDGSVEKRLPIRSYPCWLL